jgi:hypothetical protein
MSDMINQTQRVMVCLLFWMGMSVCTMSLAASDGTPETGRPVGARDPGDQVPNPHSDLIFRATGANSCGECHAFRKDGVLIPTPMDNELVKTLRDKAKGVHGPGRFADCLRCHAGGRKGVEKY